MEGMNPALVKRASRKQQQRMRCKKREKEPGGQGYGGEEIDRPSRTREVLLGNVLLCK